MQAVSPKMRAILSLIRERAFFREKSDPKPLSQRQQFARNHFTCQYFRVYSILMMALSN